MEMKYKLSMELEGLIEGKTPDYTLPVRVCHATLPGENTEEYERRLGLFYAGMTDQYRIVPFMRHVETVLPVRTISDLLKDINVIRISSTSNGSEEL